MKRCHMPADTHIRTGMDASTTDRVPGIQILNRTTFIPGRHIGRYSQKSPFTGTTDMKNILPLLFIFSFSAMADHSDPIEQAIEFNKWYVNQIDKDAFPITDGNEIDKYVTASTLKKLRHAQDPRYADEEFYEADIFLKAQYVGDDWPQNVTAITGDTDPVCVNVYIAFGKKQDHVVIDCMVKENNLWKVQSVSNADFSRNLAIAK